MLAVYLVSVLMLTGAAVRTGHTNCLSLTTCICLLFSGFSLWDWHHSALCTPLDGVLDSASQVLLCHHLDVSVLVAILTVAYSGSCLSLLSWSMVTSDSSILSVGSTDLSSHIDMLYPTAWWSGIALCMCQHVLMIQVLIELQSIAVYVMSAKSVSSSGLKSSVLYYLIGALASTLLGAGSSLLYASTGSLNLSLIQGYALSSVSYTTGITIWLTSLLVKSGVAPYHQWATAVYSMGTWSVVTWIAVAPKVPLLQVLSLSHGAALDWLLVLVSLVSLVVGAVLAIGEHEWRLLIAYSTLANVGYVLLMQLDWSPVWLLYLAQYTATTLTVYSVLSRLYSGRACESALWLSLGVCLMSLAGIPPLLGFVAKWVLVISLAESTIWVSLLVVLSMSVLTCYVYLTLLATASSSVNVGLCPYGAGAAATHGWGQYWTLPVSCLSYLDASLTVLNVCALLAPDLLYDVLLYLSLRLSMIVYIVLVVLVSLALLAANWVLSTDRSDEQKVSTYECGFEPFESQTREPMTISFYLVGLLFLLLDLELLLLYPYGSSVSSIDLMSLANVSAFFSLLTLGFIYEWSSGALHYASPTQPY